ncbi:MAG: DUF1587 domain-containing protein, partial [Planctomycetia bacterium]|nr:DUF1587 domain-containing protein [Planctomycetia bacterium]
MDTAHDERRGGSIQAGRAVVGMLVMLAAVAARAEPAATATLAGLVRSACGACHAGGAAEGGLDLDALGLDLDDAAVRDRFVLMHDRVADRQMPPDESDLVPAARTHLVEALSAALVTADAEAIRVDGRVPLRRLNRAEYQETLRDVLALPTLDVADRLPEDLVRDGFNKSAEGLDVSRIQLDATLDAAEAAVTQALPPGASPQAPDHYGAFATRLFAEGQTFGEREAMFFAKDGTALSFTGPQLAALRASLVQDPAIECCIFRSAYWPYYGYPAGFIARRAGVYRVRFRARAVLQHPGFTIGPADQPVPMTFRARRRSGPDVSGDVRAVGGIFDILPEPRDFETTVLLHADQTIEYSVLGLPVPLARNVAGGPPTYRYPPFPEGGQPGVAIQSLEITGPLPPDPWPPASYQVLFGTLTFRAAPSGDPLPVEVATSDPVTDARRLLAGFADRAVIAPLDADDLAPYERLVGDALAAGVPFTRALLTGQAALLASPHVVYLREPRGLDGPAGRRPLDVRPRGPALVLAVGNASGRRAARQGARREPREERDARRGGRSARGRSPLRAVHRGVHRLLARPATRPSRRTGRAAPPRVPLRRLPCREHGARVAGLRDVAHPRQPPRAVDRGGRLRPCQRPARPALRAPAARGPRGATCAAAARLAARRPPHAGGDPAGDRQRHDHVPGGPRRVGDGAAARSAAAETPGERARRGARHPRRDVDPRPARP